MPEGTPDASLVWSGKIGFFSIDTSLIQSAGYRFDDGQLNQLPKQLPKSMSLAISEVVVREVVSHRMKSVVDAVRQMELAADNIARLTSLDVSDVMSDFKGLAVIDTAKEGFWEEVESYAKRCRGCVVFLKDHNILGSMFDRYFQEIAPFEPNKSKKSEFPDAACLLSLEAYAQKAGVMGIVASADEGWKNFAESSKSLYWVRSLDELTAIFVSSDALSKSVESRVFSSMEDEGSFLHDRLREALNDHVRLSDWGVYEIYSRVAAHVEGTVHSASLRGYVVEKKYSRSWAVDGDPTSWVIEMTLLVSVMVLVEAVFFAHDWSDREEVEVTSELIGIDEEMLVEAYISVSGVSADSEPENWVIDIDMGYGKYRLDVGEVNPTFAD
ncbi:PIN domain-containing protein [Pseudomonas aeruginosa]|nr:hypothetical protein [Pseudomonas aeruginosa]MDP5424276.1 PIN domain-containing protein [Pseudomonas aeruginosa]